MSNCNGNIFHRWKYSERGGVRSWYCPRCNTLIRKPVRARKGSKLKLVWNRRDDAVDSCGGG